MDSLERVTTSRIFLDSVDRESNRFSVMDLLGSYTYKNSFKQYEFKISSPLLKTRFNPIQGFNTNLELSFEKKGKGSQDYKLGFVMDYGFSDKRLNPVLTWNHKANKFNNLTYGISIGRKLVQPGEQEIMSRFINSLTSLIQEKNYIKLYQKEFVQFSISRHFIPGFTTQMNVGYAFRTGIPNHSTYTFNGEGKFEPNIYEEEETMSYRNKLNISLRLAYRPGVKYLALPGELQKIESSKPLFYIEYDKSVGINEKFVDYDFLKGGIKGGFSAGFLGNSNVILEGGTFLSAKRVDDIDDQYFIGNERYYVKNYKFRDAFQLLPYYFGSNHKSYALFRFDHFFNGLILDKIPLIRNLKVEEVFNINALFQEDERFYYEMGIGINGLFRFANLRYSWGFYGTEFYDKKFTFSFNFPFI